jgi:hypothetical protein
MARKFNSFLCQRVFETCINCLNLSGNYSVNFLKKKVPESIVERGGVSYIDGRKKRFRNVLSACVFLRKNFRNGVRARYVTKHPRLTICTSRYNSQQLGILCPHILYHSQCKQGLFP